MTALLTPRFWIALALVAGLSFTHLFTYRSGKAKVRADWDKERAAQVQTALTESEARRNKEKALTFTNEGIANAYEKEKNRLVAVQRATADGLRDFQAALGSPAGTDTAAEPGVDDPNPRIARECAASLVLLDGYAQSVAAQARALQDYAREMHIKQP